MNAAAPYTVRRVEQMLGLPRTTIAALVASGFVQPARGLRNELRFTFQDLLLLRTAQALRVARLPTRRILRALTALRARLPSEMPLTGLRISAVGDQIAVQEGGSAWDAETGQLLLSFEGEAKTGGLVTAVLEQSAEAHTHDAEAIDWFDRGVGLEATDDVAAEAAYRRAVQLYPCFEDAYLNLGAMLCEAKRCGDAVRLYDDAVKHCGDAPLIHFNRGIALEDQGKVREAIEAYGTSLELDPALADAHYNIAVILERHSDLHGALRHFNAYRRLQ